MLLFFALSCKKEDLEIIVYNPIIDIAIPRDFPALNPAFYANQPTLYGVALGKKLFFDKRLSIDNSISCASCHQQAAAFADNNIQAIGVEGRIGLRNVPPIQNLAFMRFYNWDGSKLSLENQTIVPIITHEEMASSIVQVMNKLAEDSSYLDLFEKAFGDKEISAERIYKSIAQYEYTLISANSKYDKVKRNEGIAFDEIENEGYEIFQRKCISCHNGALFTDASFRNIGFPVNNNSNEAGRARVTGEMSEYMSFRVPSLRNVEYTAPYGSFGQFATLKEVLDYFDNGVLPAHNLDVIFKDNDNKIALSEAEKEALIAFMKTLSDKEFVGRE